MLINLVNDNPGEDRRYVIGTVDLGDTSVEQLEKDCSAIRERLEGEDYESEDILDELEKLGYDIIPTPAWDLVI